MKYKIMFATNLISINIPLENKNLTINLEEVTSSKPREITDTNLEVFVSLFHRGFIGIAVKGNNNYILYLRKVEE
jgi:hypothetical protein